MVSHLHDKHEKSWNVRTIHRHSHTTYIYLNKNNFIHKPPENWVEIICGQSDIVPLTWTSSMTGTSNWYFSDNFLNCTMKMIIWMTSEDSCDNLMTHSTKNLVQCQVHRGKLTTFSIIIKLKNKEI